MRAARASAAAAGGSGGQADRQGRHQHAGEDGPLGIVVLVRRFVAGPAPQGIGAVPGQAQLSRGRLVGRARKPAQRRVAARPRQRRHPAGPGRSRAMRSADLEQAAGSNASRVFSARASWRRDSRAARSRGRRGGTRSSASASDRPMAAAAAAHGQGPAEAQLGRQLERRRPGARGPRITVSPVRFMDSQSTADRARRARTPPASDGHWPAGSAISRAKRPEASLPGATYMYRPPRASKLDARTHTGEFGPSSRFSSGTTTSTRPSRP